MRWEHVQYVSVFLPRMWSWSPTSTKSGTHAKKLEKEKHRDPPCCFSGLCLAGLIATAKGVMLVCFIEVAR